jgi:glucose/arabinose dehydrogenase
MAMVCTSSRKRLFSVLGVVTAFAAHDAVAQSWASAYTSPTATGECSALSPSLGGNFTVTPIVSRALHGNDFARPMKMAFDLNPTSGLADIYISQKYGEIQYYNSDTKTLTNIGTVPGVWRSFSEDGLGGIALDPNFKTNRHIYVSFSYRNGETSTPAGAASQSNPSADVGLRVSRFTLNATTKMLDPASEVVVLHIPAAMGERYHTGGSLRFDNFGNLYISVGDNESLFMGPGNTADLRGSILRIKPTASGSYTIPSGNFGEYWSTQFNSQGRATLSTQYKDTSKVKPEIYIKGNRNPYVFGLDPHVQGRISWAECGPDNQRREEASVSSAPAFSGFPFWVGDSVRQSTFDNTYNEVGDINSTALYGEYNPVGMSLDKPVNTWPGSGGITRKGVDTLPPMHKPVATWNGAAVVGSGTGNTCAMGGPIIRYDGRIANPGKMPPHLDHTMLWGDFMGQTYYLRKLDPATGAPTGENYQVFTSADYPRPGMGATAPGIGRHIDWQQGPDGALYVLNHGAGCCNGNSGGQSGYTGIVRITYNGNCADPGLFPSGTSIANQVVRGPVDWLKVNGRTVTVTAQGAHEATILDVTGRALHVFRGEGPSNYTVPEMGTKGVHIVRVKTSTGIAVRTLSSL